VKHQHFIYWLERSELRDQPSQGCVIVALQGCVIVALQGCVIVALKDCVIIALQCKVA
jgi:hypothetical protein